MVFITIPWFLPAYKAGGPVQSIANLVNNFQEGIEYRIFCGNKDLNSDEALPVQTDQWLDLNEHTKVWYASDEISKNLTDQTELLKPDVVFMIGIFSWHFNLVPLFYSKAPLKILSVRGMLHAGALAQRKLKKQLFLTGMKLSGISKRIVFHATDETERAFIHAAFGNEIKVKIAKNFGRKITAQLPVQKERAVLKLVTVALISPMKNHLKVLQALAEITSVIEYSIYGPVKDPAYWESCLQQIKLLPENITVKYHGETDPAFVENMLAQHHLFIMPSESENFAHAIYEALSAGKPVITSNGTPWNGLQDAEAGINTNVDVPGIANAISYFAEMNNETYLRFVNGAKTYVASKTNDEYINEQYKNLFSLKI